MPLSFYIPQGAKIEVLGVTLTAERAARFALDDHNYQFVKATAETPRKIIPVEKQEG